MADVFYTEVFGEWYDSLDETEQRSVDDAADLLEAAGASVGRLQLRDHLTHRHLCVLDGRLPLRIFYCFDPQRNVALLIGGDRTGAADFYDRMIEIAEKAWQEYLPNSGRGKWKGGPR